MTVWRKSSRSTGCGECVEVALPRWRTSTRSAGSGACVEVALGDLVRVRDSKDPGGPDLRLPAAGWAAFVDTVRSGALDRDADR